MDNSDKIKALSENILVSLFKGVPPIELEEFNALTQDDKKRILFGITNRKIREERKQFIEKLDKKKALKKILKNK